MEMKRKIFWKRRKLVEMILKHRKFFKLNMIARFVENRIKNEDKQLGNEYLHQIHPQGKNKLSSFHKKEEETKNRKPPTIIELSKQNDLKGFADIINFRTREEVMENLEDMDEKIKRNKFKIKDSVEKKKRLEF